MDELTLALERFDLAAYVQHHVGQRVGRDEFLVGCPVCGKDKVSINTRTRRWHCFVCQKYERGPDGLQHVTYGGGGVFHLVKWLEGKTSREAAQYIIEASQPKWVDPDALPDLVSKARAEEDDGERCPAGLPEGCIPVDGTLPYMQRRGITTEDARTFGLGWVGSGWLANRLVFPVWERGQCVYWQARACWDKEEHAQWYHDTPFRKTLNPAVRFCGRCRVRFADNFNRCHLCNGPRQFGSEDVLLNLEQASRYPRVAICEGPTSAIRTGPDAVATFGKVLQPAKIALLIRAGVKAIDFMWDGPTKTEPMGAWPEMIASASQLAPFFDVRLVFLPQSDPGDWPREALNYFRSIARPYGDHGLLHL